MHPCTYPVTLTAKGVSISVAALIDSGSAGNFIAGHLARRLRLRTEPTEWRYQVQSIDGKPLSNRDVQRRAGPIQLDLGVCHQEEIWLLVLEGSMIDIVLGCPWLARHEPILSWGTGEILKWGSQCWPTCFPKLPLCSPKSLTVCTTSIESPIEKQSIDIPSEYHSFQDVFCPRRAARLPPHCPWDCAINLLPDAQLPKGRIYPLSIPETKAMEEYIQEALAHGYIRPSTSPAASSFFFVAKKDGGLRPCIDYRALNKVTIPFKYPLPLVPAALEKLRGAKIFSKLDLRSAYNLIRVRRGDEWKTAFSTPTGHYEYLVMPYGLVNAPSIFQDCMHEIFREYLDKFVLIYIDDILIFSSTLQEHHQHVKHVLTKLREHQLYLKADKCSFHQKSTQFLGYNIDPAGVSMDHGKVEAITKWPKPITIKELQRFLGFSNFYRRFIEGYSMLASPLTSMLKGKPKTLTWSSDATQAFQQLKTAFTSAPILRHPDPSKQFIVEVDASTTGVGAILSQQQGNPPQLKPCAYFSRKLTPAEKNYDIGNRELLAIKLALEEWRHWLEGPGSKNVRADALSRLHAPEEEPESTEPILPEKLFSCPIQWVTPPAASDPAPAPPPGCPPNFRFVPEEERFPLIHATHTLVGTGHPGTNRTLSLLKQQFWWPMMESYVQRIVRGCRECAMAKTPRHLPAGKLGLPAAWETAQNLFHHVFRPYGLPENIVSDRGPQFISRVWWAFFRLLGVAVSLSSGYHPQTNGQTERKIQEVGRFLRTFCHDHQNTWNQFLGWAEYAQNSLRQDTTGLTPFQCVLGFQPPLFPWSGGPSDVPTVDHWFRESERVWDMAHQHLQRAVRRQKTIADRRRSDAPTYQVGQKVWLSTRDIRLRLPCKKLSPRYVGPFTITEQVNQVTYKLQLPPHYRIHPTFHVSLLKPCHDPLLPPTEPGVEQPPPPMVVEEGTIYQVKEILDSRRRGGRLEYLIDWEGYGPEEGSWVPRDDVLDETLLREFHETHPNRPAPRGRGRPPRRRRGSASGGGPGGGDSVTSTPGSTLTDTQRAPSPEY
ncbi:Transposon Tf2-6 polyprotein [Labeo rohita]|uniref:Gypsy retrotransposon integrase-like protein 1 n=1 Tax=Labeo rohita TaxID=84645 RepID=A0ABQ8LG19_LABRO|nr:Transposon Tf2-6 polyprotein [Labeo rohita]